MFKYLTWGRVISSGLTFNWPSTMLAGDLRLVTTDRIVPSGNKLHQAQDVHSEGVLIVRSLANRTQITWKRICLEVQPGLIKTTTIAGVEAFIDRVVFPVLETLDGWLTLHAAAATSPRGQTMVFLGESGIGKSTTVSQLHANGWIIRADDIISIETPNLLRPSSSSIRLRTAEREKFDFPDSGKMRVLCEPQTQTVPIDRLVILKRGPLSLEQVPTPFVSMLPFVMDLTDWEPERRGRRITMLAELLSKVPVFQLSFPAADLREHQVPQISLLESL